MRSIARAALLAVLALAGGPTASGVSDLAAQTPKHNCSFCHNLHGGSYAALSDFAVAEDLCLSCHSDAGPAQVDRDGVLVDVPKQQSVHNGSQHSAPTTCWDCHNHEGDAEGNLFMIPRTVTVQGVDTTVIFTSDATQADFTGPNGVCYVCHTNTGTRANGLNGHNGPDVCTTCHTHDGGFQGAGGGCTTCHNSARGNHRSVVAEFDRASHHVQLGGAGADIPETDCTVCHDQNSIVLSDATAHPREGSDHVVLIDQDGGGAITYDPGVDDASVITPFCLSCHDADGGAGGDTSPFSDGLVRPEIDETAWTASSHAVSDTADCADCHEVHGSEKLHLLRPGSLAPDPTTRAEEEEGFCLGCHASSGPASSDLKSAFDRPINWVQQAAGLHANPNLNDRHDIQQPAQARSGAKVECVNCHDPHRANAALPYVLDPDPGDGHVPGTNYYYYSATSDTLSEFCLDCHDGSLPSGVLDHTGGSPAGLVNIQSTWAADGMGARDASGTVGLYAPSGWTGNVIMACSSCHNPHPVIDADANSTNHFAINDTTKSPTGTPLSGWWMRSGGQWIRSFAYSLISNASGADPLTDGGTYCNTCHDRTSMVGKDNCYDCHRHGDGGRW